MTVVTSLKQLVYHWRKYIFEGESLCFYSLELNRAIPNLEIEGKIEVSFVTRGEGEKQLYQLISRDVVCSRLQEGQKCCIAVRGDKIVSYCWMTQERTHIGEIKRNVKLGKKNIYFYDCYTIPEERGKGIYPSLLLRASQSAFHEGFKRALIFSESSNLFSQKGISKAGFQLIGKIVFSRILGNVRLRKNEFDQPNDFIEVL